MDGDNERQWLAIANSNLRSDLLAIKQALDEVGHGENWDPDGNADALRNISRILDRQTP